jgi:hypothetical protein
MNARTKVPGAVRLYRACLWLLPRRLRRAHGDEMAQVFGQAWRDAGAQRGRRGAAAELARSLADLLRVAAVERGLGHALATVVLGAAAAWIDRHSTEVQPAVLVLLLCSFGLSAQAPRHALRTAILLGASIPAGTALGLALGLRFAYGPTSSATALTSFVALVPAALGAALGAAARRVSRRT